MVFSSFTLRATIKMHAIKKHARSRPWKNCDLSQSSAIVALRFVHLLMTRLFIELNCYTGSIVLD